MISSGFDMATQTNDEKTIRGCCPMDCPDTCSWIVTVKDGRAVKLRGDPDHTVTRGSLCAKMNGYIEYTRLPGRLMWPLRRSGRKGAGQFERISWDEALDEIAARFQRIIVEHGAEAIWPFYGAGSYGMLQGIFGAGRRLWHALGTSQHFVNICTIAGCVATEYTLGDRRVGMDPETFQDSKLIILWGTNTLTTNLHLWRFVQMAKEKGAYVVVIDPMKTRTAEQVDEHIPILPGTDAALALGLMNVVVSLGAEDKEFIEAHTLGWPDFKKRILDYTPERVSEITEIPVEVIVALGTRLANSRPTGIKLLMGMQRHGGGGMAVRTISCIPGVTGDWRYAGGGVSYDTRGFFRGDWNALWRPDLLPSKARTLNMTQLGEGLLELDDPPVQGLFIYAANPVASDPHQRKVRQGLERDDLFTVVFDHFQTDTANYADIILPCTMQLEHADLHTTFGHIYVSWNEPAVAPPGECRSTSDVFRDLARRMGLTEPCLYDSDEDMARQVLNSGHPTLAGITLEKLKADGWARPNYPSPFVPFADGFMTPSGKLEFYSERMANDGLEPLAGYTPSYEVSQKDTALACKYPLALLSVCRHYGVNSIFPNSEPHARRQGPAVLQIHPNDASSRNLRHGGTARVFNDRGDFLVQIQVTDKVKPGIVWTVKSRWPMLEPGNSNPNATIDDRTSDMGSGAVYNDNRVEVAAI